jgi:succinate-semialdehyde dehydrogenase/glutarate-semialdehyde dehydrogenase
VEATQAGEKQMVEQQPFSTLIDMDVPYLFAGQHERFAVVNPVDGAFLQSVPWGERPAISQAIQQCHAGLRIRRSTSERGAMLLAIAAQLVSYRQELARIITAENGKPIAESGAEVDYAAGFFRYYGEHVGLLRSRRLKAQPRGHEWTIRYRPSGVAALIVPWNFPLAMLAKKLSATIAAGTPCVIKPAEQTPLASLALLRLLQNAAVPSSWVRWVLGEAAMIGEVCCNHPAVRYISFTGSTAVGKILLRQTTEQCKRLTLELGGNAPLIVLDDADLGLAVEHIMQNKFRCAGQTCVCVNRIYVHQSRIAELTDRLVDRVAKLRMGDGREAGVDLGPLIDKQGYKKVVEHVRDAIARGGKLVLGGVPTTQLGEGGQAEDAETIEQTSGWFFPPTLITEVPHDALCTREETFGPMLPIIPFTSDHQALAWANRTEYGLAAYVFTSSGSRSRLFLQRLQFGHIGLNSATGPTPEAPFGGIKQSGFGREGGRDGLFEFVESQVVARDRHMPMS